MEEREKKTHRWQRSSKEEDKRVELFLLRFLLVQYASIALNLSYPLHARLASFVLFSVVYVKFDGYKKRSRHNNFCFTISRG